MKTKFVVWLSLWLSICWLAAPSRGESVTKTTGKASQSLSLARDLLLEQKMQEAASIKLWNETVWYTKAADNDRWYKAVEENERKAREEAAQRAQLKASRSSAVRSTVYVGAIGDRIAGCEGGTAYLHRDHGPRSTASGKYGFLDSTWDGLDGVKNGAGFMGYKRAMDAPEEIQDKGFAILWNDGKGASNWSESKGCWG